MRLERVTQEYLESKIVKESYFQAIGTTLIVCLLTLDNGITVTGDSACLNQEDFDEDVGRRIAREEAVNKLWFAEGYHRAEARAPKPAEETES